MIFFLSSTCSSKRQVNEALEELAHFGIRNIELSGNLVFYDGWKEDLINLKQKFSLDLLIHNYFPPIKENAFVLNLASSNDEIRTRSLKLIQSAVELMDEIGIQLYSIHGGMMAQLHPGLENSDFIVDERKIEDRDKALKNFYTNIDFIMRNFFKEKFRLAVENIYPYRQKKDYFLMMEPKEIFDFFEYSKRYENLGFLLDFGHLNISAKIFGFDKLEFSRQIFSRYPNKIFELHLSENDGFSDEHGITRDNSWQMAILRDYQEVLQQVPIVFEWHNKENSQEIGRRLHEIECFSRSMVFK